ncbi:MAG: FtsW/RodA/SpoVE family cell cycle protein [Lentisphaeria bacterium]|nr:FtsW/RodA/SpoVE family cell cycle protein [Lentisphaeria bacterium]
MAIVNNCLFCQSSISAVKHRNSCYNSAVGIGITLPFFSYGGSSMVTMYAAMGIISGVKYKPKPERFALIY